MFIPRDTLNNPEGLSACPACDFLRDSPAADCPSCGYEPHAIAIDADRDPSVHDDRGDHDRPVHPIVRMLSASIGIGLLSLVLLMGLAGVFGDPDRVNRGVMRLLATVTG